MPPPSSDTRAAISTLSAARWRVALILTAAMMVLYLGFILLVAFNKPLLATQLRSGLSLGMLLGVIVIVSAWLLIYAYVRWANMYYDQRVARLQQQYERPLQEKK